MASYNDVIKGMTILAKYEKKGLDSHGIAANHDEIYAGSVAPEDVSEEDREQLEKCHWHYDEGVSSWRRFV